MSHINARKTTFKKSEAALTGQTAGTTQSLPVLLDKLVWKQQRKEKENRLIKIGVLEDIWLKM